MPATQVTQSATYPSEPQPRQRFAEYITAPGQRLDLSEGMARNEFPPPEVEATIPAPEAAQRRIEKRILAVPATPPPPAPAPAPAPRPAPAPNGGDSA